MAQRLQNLSDAGAVIIGGTPGRGIAGWPARWCFLGEKIGGLLRNGLTASLSAVGQKRSAARLRGPDVEGLLDGGQRLLRCVF